MSPGWTNDDDPDHAERERERAVSRRRHQPRAVKTADELRHSRGADITIPKRIEIDDTVDQSKRKTITASRNQPPP